MLTMDTYYYGHQSFAISRLIYVIFVRFLAAKISLKYYMYVMCFLSFHHIGSIITDCTYNCLTFSMAIHITQNTTNKLLIKSISASIIHGSAVGPAAPASYVVDASDLQEAVTKWKYTLQ